ncbi:hypothetical protein FNV43_RR03164 [Rhamnella rubrinervis]|uniref:Oxysterol-binding protein n=1 Tax=Rhamnella rubrinervis TaxID=2594499 RepID=A0A8K0HH88_9ROSA|nr:hypothetical protein FNV43_RR03164 [Rhamnella rubrinervis]
MVDEEFVSTCGAEEVTEWKEEPRVVLAKPLSLEGESEVDEKAPNLILLVLSLFTNIRPGSDLTGMQLPPAFNIPKSQLQCISEPVYCVKNDMLETCNRRENPVDRFSAVVAWSISTIRPLNFGFAPFNPILGETHHVSRGTLNVLLEQVSHHPPVTALHATDDEENVELLWCQYPTPRFYGTSVETEVRGKRHLKLHNHGETYEMSSPKLLIKLIPVPGVDWIGKDRIRCQETGLEAELDYGGKSFFGLRGSHRSIKGKIFKSSSMKLLFKIDGHWDRTVTIKDVNSGEVTVIYNAKDSISGLKTPIVKDHKGLWPSESAVVWSEVNKGILSKDLAQAKEAKKAIEEKQREILRARESSSSGGHQTWVPQHFIVSINKEGGWDCSPIEIKVPPAPIIVPL